MAEDPGDVGGSTSKPTDSPLDKPQNPPSPDRPATGGGEQAEPPVNTPPQPKKE